MTKEQADFLMDACAYFDIECERHDNYSGRGMHGSTTYALSGDPLDILGAGINYALEDPHHDNETLLDGFLGLRLDSYGTSSIIY